MIHLAIKGHEPRGEEVIEILEMLGGENYSEYNGKSESMCYYIDENGHIECDIEEEIHFPVDIFSLEDFLEKFPYKIGNKVIDMNGLYGTITAMSWDECNCTVRYTFKDDEVGTNRHGYIAMMLKPYIVDTGCCFFQTTQPSYTLSVESMKDMKRSIIFDSDSPNETELIFGDNFEIQVKDGKTYVVRKQPQYPKTYGECCEILGFSREGDIVYSGNWVYGYAHLGQHLKSLRSFSKLLICRDTYWKIAGDWKPTYSDDCIKYTISNYGGKIILSTATVYNRILSFPTEEMRDAFYDNFKELIEECKELL